MQTFIFYEILQSHYPRFDVSTGILAFLTAHNISKRVPKGEDCVLDRRNTVQGYNLPKTQARTNTSGVNFTSNTSFLISLMSAWCAAEEGWWELLGGRPGDRPGERRLGDRRPGDLRPGDRDRDRDLDGFPRRLEGELEVEPLFLCLKEAKGWRGSRRQGF